MLKILFLLVWSPDPYVALFTWFYDRLSEASTWSGLGIIFISLSTAFPNYSNLFNGMAGICGAVAFAIKEKSLKSLMGQQVNTDNPNNNDEKSN